MLTIKEAFLTENPYYKQARTISVECLVLHSVGCAQPSAAVFLKNWNKETYSRACVHAFIDANDGTVYQTMPWDWRAPHAGNSWLNGCSVGVEMCESSYVKYIGQSDRFSVINRAAALAHAKTTYLSAVALFAYLCLRFNLDPATAIYSHNEAHDELGRASDHSDPEHYWEQLGTGYTMKGFRQDVANAMNGKATVTILDLDEEEKEMFPILKKGSRGEAVKALQKMLEATGYSCGKAGIDGDFGSGTEVAVKSFQMECGLTEDGVAGKATWGSLVNAPNAAMTSTALLAAETLAVQVEQAVKTFREKVEV